MKKDDFVEKAIDYAVAGLETTVAGVVKTADRSDPNSDFGRGLRQLAEKLTGRLADARRELAEVYAETLEIEELEEVWGLPSARKA